MRAAVAAIASLCLLGTASGCSWLATRPSTGTRIMDAGWVITGFVSTPALYCTFGGTGSGGDDGCLPQIAGAVVISVPVLLSFAVAAGMSDADDARSAPTKSVDLPEIATDAQTIQLARQVETQVRAHQCASARVTMNRIADRDAEYHIAMLAKGALGACALGGPGNEQDAKSDSVGGGR